MRKIILAVLAALVCVSAFAKHKHRKKQQKTGNIISVSIRRTPCYGRCPDYTIEINNLGTATYNAKRFNPDTGLFQKNIGIENAQKIIGMFNTYRVDTCRDNYRLRASDLPGLIFTIVYDDSTKTINNANFGPYFLKQIAASIDAVGKKTDSTWQKITLPMSR